MCLNTKRITLQTTNYKLQRTSIVRTTLVCPFSLATSRGVWQSSFIINALAESLEPNNQYACQSLWGRKKKKKG